MACVAFYGSLYMVQGITEGPYCMYVQMCAVEANCCPCMPNRCQSRNWVWYLALGQLWSHSIHCICTTDVHMLLLWNGHTMHTSHLNVALIFYNAMQDTHCYLQLHNSPVLVKCCCKEQSMSCLKWK